MKRIEFATRAELAAAQLLLGVGAAGLSTGIGPGQKLKRDIEAKHGVEITTEDIESVLKLFGTIGTKTTATATTEEEDKKP